MKVTHDQVIEALDSLEKGLPQEDMSKASETDLDQPEGSDMDGKQIKDKKMSDHAPGPDKSPLAAKKSYSDETAKGGYMKKKMKKDMDEMDMDNEEDEMEDMDMDKAKHAKKSFADDMPEEVQTKIDVSEFLKSLVNHTAESVDALREYVAKSDIAHESRYGELADAVEEIQKSQAKIGVVLKAVCERIGIIEKSPARAPKAETEISKSQVAERQFDNPRAEGSEEQPKLFKSLSRDPRVAKSQVSEALCDLVRKGEATDLDVIGFESGGYIKPELVTKLQETLN